MSNYIEATSGKPEVYTTRKVTVLYEVCDKSGYPYPCDLEYEIIEETKEVISLKVRFHFGSSSSAFEATEEVVKEYVNELESGVEFLCTIEIE